MGLFDRLFGRAEKVYIDRYFKLLDGYTPVFHSWGGEVYESEIARAAIDARARHISKLGITITGSAKPKLQRLLKAAPNEWQTWSQFFYRLSTILDVKNTAFIVPVIGEFGETTGFYPIVPDKYEVIEWKGVPYLRYHFESGETAAIELSRMGIMTKFQYKSDFFGTSNAALNPTMELINIQNQGITEAVKNSASFRFMGTMNNFATDEDIDNERKRFNEANLKKNGGGLLLFSNLFRDVKQVDSKPYTVDDKQMQLIRTNVFEYFGVNEDVLQNKVYGDAWSAFYEGAIEPFAIQFSEVMTKALYTITEITNGNGIMATANRLQYMSNADKLNVSQALLDRGIFSLNDVREIWNLPPVENGDTRIIRGEYYDATVKLEGGTDEDSTEQN